MAMPAPFVVVSRVERQPLERGTRVTAHVHVGSAVRSQS